MNLWICERSTHNHHHKVISSLSSFTVRPTPHLCTFLWKPLIKYSTTLYLSFPEVCINRTIRYWPSELNFLQWVSNPSHACSIFFGSAFLFFSCWVFHGIYVLEFINSPTGRYLGCFQSGMIMNKAIMNICIHILHEDEFSFMLDKYSNNISRFYK